MADLPSTAVADRNRRSVLRTQTFRLVFVNTERAGTAVQLAEGMTKVGKSLDCELIIDHPTVSRNHATITRLRERWIVRDLGSTNGTWLDGAEVTEAYLRPGARLSFGDVTLKLEAEGAPLQVDASTETRLGGLVGKSEPMRQIFTLIQRVAPTDATVLLTGETGSGKGALAKALHELSPRRNGPFVVFDCAGVSTSLIESELFGHEKGAFSGAELRHMGHLERAHGGTVLLDDLDELALDLQPKLLRALEERQFLRVGGNTPVSVDVRVIASSKKDLWGEVQAGRFREDLFFRVAVIAIHAPPLRERREDLEELVDDFAGFPFWQQLGASVRDELIAHQWPGNVRELRNVVERLALLRDEAESGGGGINEGLLNRKEPEEAMLRVKYSGEFRKCKEAVVRDFEREYLRRLIDAAGGNMALAARMGGMDRKHLYDLAAKHGLER